MYVSIKKVLFIIIFFYSLNYCLFSIKKSGCFDGCNIENNFSKKNLKLLKDFLIRFYPYKYSKLYIGKFDKLQSNYGAIAYTNIKIINKFQAIRKIIKIFHKKKSINIEYLNIYKKPPNKYLNNSNPWISLNNAVKTEKVEYIKHKKTYYFIRDKTIAFKDILLIYNAYNLRKIKTEEDFIGDPEIRDSVFIMNYKDEFDLNNLVHIFKIDDVKEFLKKHDVKWFNKKILDIYQITIRSSFWSGYRFFITLDKKNKEIVILSSYFYV